VLHAPRRPPRSGGLLRFRRLALTTTIGGGWRLEGRAWTGDASYRLTLRNEPHDPQIQLELEATYLREVVSLLEVLRFRTGRLQHVAMLDRALRLVPVVQPGHAGALTPHVASFHGDDAEVGLVATEGLQGLRIAPGGRGRFVVDLELEHRANHPFWVRRTCTAAPLHPPLRPLMGSQRCPGVRARLRATFAAGPTLPLRLARFPRDLQAAVAFTDHADQSSRARLEAFAFGETGAGERGLLGPTFPGFVNRGLVYTKTVFIRRVPRYWSQLDNPGYSAVLDRMARRGVEIGVHSPTGGPDRPADARRLLTAFRALHSGRTWIDHQPDTNCEAVTSRGWRPGPWYMLRHLHELGFRYLWSGIDLDLPPDSLNMLAPGRAATRRPLIYRHSRLGGCADLDLTLFSSSYLFSSRDRLLRRFSARALDRLAYERGLLIGHVYLDTWRPRGRFKPRCLLESTGPGQFQLHPEVDRLFRRLRDRQARGQLWVTGVGPLADHVSRAMRTRLRYLSDGVVTVSTATPLPVRDLTLLVPVENARVLVDGRPPKGSRAHAGVTAVWLDLVPGQPRQLRVLDRDGRPVPLLRPARIVLR
jgi:hypothetical protein